MAGQASQPSVAHNKMTATDSSNVDQAPGAGAQAIQTVNGVTTTASGAAPTMAADAGFGQNSGGFGGFQTVNGVTTGGTNNGGGGNSNVATAGGKSVQTVNGVTQTATS